MNIAGVGNTGIDYSRLSTRQAEQQEVRQESVEDAAKAVESVQESTQSASSNNQYSAESFSGSQVSAYTAANASQQVSEAPAYTAGSTDSGNTTLTNKARSGAELTQSEMSQLKELDSALYSQAVKAQKARTEAREQMKANPSSSGRIASDTIAKTGGGEDAGSSARAVMEEYRSFAAKYDQAAFSSSSVR